jgi:putative endonuclease
MNNRKGGQVYIGVTADLFARTEQHRTQRGSKWAARYHCTRLVYYEQYDRIEDAIAREKAMKEWKRSWKNELIETVNPDWCDLWETLNG